MRLKKEYEKAIADYNEAIRLNPKSTLVFSNRGNTWRFKKEYEKAIADYDEAIRLNPKYATAYRGRGEVWSEMKFKTEEMNDLIQRFNLSIDRLISDPNEIASKNEEYEKAIAKSNEAIRLDPIMPSSITIEAEYGLTRKSMTKQLTTTLMQFGSIPSTPWQFYMNRARQVPPRQRRCEASTRRRGGKQKLKLGQNEGGAMGQVALGSESSRLGQTPEAANPPHLRRCQPMVGCRLRRLTQPMV